MTKKQLSGYKATGVHRLKTIGLLYVLTTVAGCTSQPFKNNDLAKLLVSAGWIVLPLPDDTIGPGTVIYFPASAKSPSLLEGLDKCGVPTSLLGVHEGDAPTINTSNDYNISVDASVKTLPADATANLGVVKKSTVKIESHGADVLTDLGGIDNWRQNPANSAAFNPTCAKYFDTPGYYLVYQSWRIKTGTYTFYSDDKGSVKVDTTKLGHTQAANASASAEGSQNGTVVFSTKTYLAIREVVPTAGGLRFAGSIAHPLKPEEFADGRLQAVWNSK